MDKLKRIIIPLLFFLCLHFSEAQSLHIGKNIEAQISSEYNRSLGIYADIGITGTITVNDRWFLKAGTAFGKTEYDYDIKAFANTGMQVFRNFPLILSCAYIYSNLPEYEVVSHTVMPLIAINGKRAGYATGVSFRYTSFFGEQAVLEPVPMLSLYLNFINNDKLMLGMRCANFSDFYAANLGALSMSFYSEINMNKQWTIMAAMELLQSGSFTFTANFYGLILRGGLRYSW